MAGSAAATLVVEAVAVHFGCLLCGGTARVELVDDPFTSQVLAPVDAWAGSHRAPFVAMVEVRVNGGGVQEWWNRAVA